MSWHTHRHRAQEGSPMRHQRSLLQVGTVFTTGCNGLFYRLERSLLQVGRHLASDSSRYNPQPQTKCGLCQSDHRGRSKMEGRDRHRPARQHDCYRCAAAPEDPRRALNATAANSNTQHAPRHVTVSSYTCINRLCVYVHVSTMNASENTCCTRNTFI